MFDFLTAATLANISDICIPARHSAKHAMFTRNGKRGPFAETTSKVKESVLFGYLFTSTISDKRSSNSLRRTMSSAPAATFCLKK